VLSTVMTQRHLYMITILRIAGNNRFWTVQGVHEIWSAMWLYINDGSTVRQWKRIPATMRGVLCAKSRRRSVVDMNLPSSVLIKRGSNFSQIHLESRSDPQASAPVHPSLITKPWLFGNSSTLPTCTQRDHPIPDEPPVPKSRACSRPRGMLL
jgi:hypothetical protein